MAYDVDGVGPPVLLMHSFGFDATLWEWTGLVPRLRASGRSVVTSDARGHGRSDRPHNPACYRTPAMVEDVRRLLDHLNLDRADVVAYSMGSNVALQLLQVEPRVEAAVLAGIAGASLTRAGWRWQPVDPVPDDVRLFCSMFPYLSPRVERKAADPQALLAVYQAGFGLQTADLETIRARVLLLSGTDDDDPAPLAARIPPANVVRVEADHSTTLEHPDFVTHVVSFLNPYT